MIAVTYPKIEYVEVFYPNGVKRLNPILSKEFITEAYLILNLSREVLCTHYSISQKVFHNSYTWWFSKEERKLIGGKKIALAQCTRNSNKHNLGKPTTLLPFETLQKYLSLNYSLDKMAYEFGVAPQTVRNNLEYLGLANELVKGGIPYKQLLTIKSLDSLLGLGILDKVTSFNNGNIDISVLDDLVLAEQHVESIKDDLRWLLKSLKHRFNRAGLSTESYNLPGSRLNSTVKNLLCELGYKVTCEFRLEGKIFDFRLISEGVLIEVDSEYYHASEVELTNDRLKNEIALKNNYRLLRLAIGKDKKEAIRKKLITCLDQLKLKV